MFSSFSQPLNNLIYSERFYFNNYEYYNDYEKLQTKYKDDLSKVIFRLNRKTKGTIFYQWNDDPSLKPIQNQKNSQSMDVENKNNDNTKNQLGIQKLLASVLENFYEQNYSNIKMDEQSKKQLYEFVHLKYINELNPHFQGSQEESMYKYEHNSIEILNRIFKKQSKQKLSYYEAIQKMNSMAKDEDQMFLERWNAFENYGFYFLDHQLVRNKTSNFYKEQLRILYKFAIKVRFIVQRTLAANYFNSLFINLPKLKKTNKLFHPLTVSLNYTNHFFEQKNGFSNKPKIVFLNLDGRETPYNLRYARNIGQNFMYISIFKQPSHHYKKNQKMEYEFESDYDTTFGNVSQCYSRLLINEAYPQQELFSGNEQKFKNKSKMLLFPMNSDYLRRQYYRNMNSKNQNSKFQQQFPILETSTDIFFLFQTVIFEEIRSFNPNFIMVSYNGFLNINEDHWNEIVKNLTIIADHKLCMFVDFIDRLDGKQASEEGQESQQEQDQQAQQQEQDPQWISQQQQNADQEEQSEQQEEEQLDELKVRNIQVIREFMGKYMRFKHFWPYLEHQRLLHSILMFLKVSSGVYFMQPRLFLNHNLKFSLGQRYAFLQGLAGSKEMGQFMVKYVGRLLKSHQIKELYGNQAKIELKQNRKQNQNYEKLIDSVIMDFLNQQNRRQRFSHNPKLLYRLQQVLQEQQYQNMIRFGSEQDHNPEYSSNISNSVLTDMRQPSIMHEYLKEMKRKLLLQNLETYKFKKYFYYDGEAESTYHSLIPQQKVKCYKFYLYEDDSEEISFEKYTQFIFDTKKAKVYIINYKANDDRHLILYGSLTPTSYEKKYNVKVQIAKQSQRQLQSPLHSYFEKDLNQHDSNQQYNFPTKKDLVFVNYSHCFVKNKLYLYWPQKWSIRDQIRHKILGLKYKPQNVNIIIRVQFNHQNQCFYETLQLKEQQKIYVNPRIGCSSYEIPSQDDEFFVFGGIQDNQNDFFDSGEAMYQILIKEKSSYFSVKPLPKIREKSTKQSSINVMNLIKKNASFALRLRPKMNYRIQRFAETSSGSQEVKLIISGGFGRQFTNYFNLFSSDSYIFNTTTKLIESKEIHARRLIKLNKPIQINRVGKFYMITNSQNIQEVEQNFSDLPKDLFAFEYKVQKSNKQGYSSSLRQNRQSVINSDGLNNGFGSQNFPAKLFQNRQVHSFIDERYRNFDFKIDSKKIYLCGFNRTVREKIYSKFWSPELYVVDGNQSSIVHISLKTQKSYSYNISNFLMPRQEDIVSLCIDEDRFYVLSSSPVIHSIEFSNSKYVLYEGNLSNMNEIINKHELQMHEKFDFKKQKQSMLKYKTLYAFDEKIYLFGGMALSQDPSILTLTSQQGMQIQGRMNNKVSYREDYILQKQKNKFVLKTRKVEAFKDSLQMTSPVIVKFNELLYFYSIEMIQQIVKKQSPFPEIKENYKIKIQQFISESSPEGRCMTQIMKFYTWDPVKNKILRIIPRLNEPKFVCISKHEPFNMSKFKEHLQKVAIRLRKKIQENTIQDQKLNDFFSKSLILLKQRNEELIIETLQTENTFFRDLINYIRPQSIQRQKKNPQQEELIKDLKLCYSHVIKLIIERLIERAKAEESISQSNLSRKQSGIDTLGNQNSMSSSFSMQSMRKQKLVQKMEKLSLNTQQSTADYRFIVEDSKFSRKIRYIAIGPLVNVEELRFFRIRFRHDVSMCLNKNNQDEFYYHPTLNACQQIDLNDRFAQYDILEEDEIKNDAFSYKQFKLFCQLKL